MAGQHAKDFISRLHSAFFDEPEAIQAFRIQRPTVAWSVSGDTIRCVEGGVELFSGSLTAYTLRSLVQALEASGVGVSDLIQQPERVMSATVLLDGSGNGGPVMAYSSLIWSIGEALSRELDRARLAGGGALVEANLATATGEWLDLWGQHFGIARLLGEGDDEYSRRIVVEVIRPRCNNVAMEVALGEAFGQAVTVTDVQEWGGASPVFDGTVDYDGTANFDASAAPIYGLFDVSVGFDLLGGQQPADYLETVRAVVDRMRAAGTYLRALVLSDSVLSDQVSAASDSLGALAGAVALDDVVASVSDVGLELRGGLSVLSDAVAASVDTLTLSVTTAGHNFDGSINFDGSASFSSGAVVVEVL